MLIFLSLYEIPDLIRNELRQDILSQIIEFLPFYIA